MPMGTWKVKLIKKTRGSQTTGRSKGINPTSLDRYMARSGRSYKHHAYADWFIKYNGNKVQSK